LITFDEVPTGNTFPLDIGSGATASVTNTDPSFTRITDIDQHSPFLLGYNNTRAAQKFNFFQVSPFSDDSVDGSVTFTFSTPIDAFGAYLTDTQVSFPGSITLTFDDGSAQSLPIIKN